MGKFVISISKNQEYYFNLRAGNAQIIGTSEMYKALASAKKGIASVQANAPIAQIEDQTAEEVQAQKINAGVYKLCIAGEDDKPQPREEVHQQPREHGVCDADDSIEIYALPGAVIILCAVVVADDRLGAAYDAADWQTEHFTNRVCNRHDADIEIAAIHLKC